MIDAQTQAVLSGLVRCLGNSLLQYITMSDPLQTADTRSEWESILTLAGEERDMLARIARWLRKNRLPMPATGAYPMTFTTINYMPIAHLLPLLANAQKQCVADLEQLTVSDECDEANTLLSDCSAMAKRHMQTLEELRPNQTPLAG